MAKLYFEEEAVDRVPRIDAECEKPTESQPAYGGVGWGGLGNLSQSVSRLAA